MAVVIYLETLYSPMLVIQMRDWRQKKHKTQHAPGFAKQTIVSISGLWKPFTPCLTAFWHSHHYNLVLFFQINVYNLGSKSTQNAIHTRPKEGESYTLCLVYHTNQL